MASVDCEFYNAVSTTDKIPFNSIVLAGIPETDITKPGHIKQGLSAWLDTSKSVIKCWLVGLFLVNQAFKLQSTYYITL